MKTAFIILDDILKGLHTDASARRAIALIPYIPDSHINSGDEFIKNCDVLIYQDRIEHHDLMIMKKLTGKIIILDLSFPVWNPYYPYSGGNKLTYFYKMIKLCSAIVVSTDDYAIDLKKYAKNQVIEVIPTGHDSKSYKKIADKYKNLIVSITDKKIAKKEVTVTKVESEPEVEVVKPVEFKIVAANEPVSIIIPVYNCLKYLKKCIKSVFKHTDNFELIIVDNGSDKQTKSYIKNLKNIRVVTNSENKGFAYACNQGIKVSKYDYYCLLNSDTIVTPGWLTKLMMGLNQPSAGIVGPSTTYCQASQRLFDKPNDNMSIAKILKINSELQEEYKEILDLQGFCFLIRKEVVDRIGVFDWKRFPTGGSEEVDYRHRALKAEIKSYWVKHSFVHHFRYKTFIENKLDKHAITKQHMGILAERTYTDTNLFIKNDVEVSSTKIDVIIPTLNRQEKTIKTLESLFQRNRNLNVIIVDNGSDNLDYLNEFDIKVIKNSKNKGITKTFNQGLKLARSKYIVLMHNDIVVNMDNWIEKAILFMDNNPRAGMVGIAGFKRLTRDVRTTNVITGIDKYAKFDYKRPKSEFEEVIVLDGCCSIIRNTGIKLDEGLDYYFYDWDLSMQYRKAEYKLYVMDSKALHFADDRAAATINIIEHKDQDAIQKQSKEYFIKKWDKSIPEEVIVTANIVGVDIPMENHFNNPGFNYIMFTDDRSIKSTFWDIRYVERKFKDPRMDARMYKWLIHKFFPDVQYSIWVDSNVVIMSELNAHIRMYLTDADIALVRHWRDCIYEEGTACAKALLDNVRVINTHLKKLRQENYPAHQGLHQTRVIIRRHTKEINALNEAVWKEIQEGSIRDQLSFNYVAWKMGIKIATLPGNYIMYPSIDKINIKDSAHFGLIWHTKHNRIYKKR